MKTKTIKEEPSFFRTNFEISRRYFEEAAMAPPDKYKTEVFLQWVNDNGKDLRSISSEDISSFGEYIKENVYPNPNTYIFLVRKLCEWLGKENINLHITEDFPTRFNFKKNQYTKNGYIHGIGGTVERAYNTLLIEVDEINDSVLPICRYFGVMPDKESFINVIQEGSIALFPFYVEKYRNGLIECLENNDPEVKEFFSRYEGNPESLNIAINTKARTRFVKESKRKDLSILLKGETTTIKYFKDSLSLSDNGLRVDHQKFLSIFDDMTRSQQMEQHTHHEEMIEAINRMFGSIPVNWDELKKYVSFSKGRAVVNPESQRKEMYIRLIR